MNTSNKALNNRFMAKFVNLKVFIGVMVQEYINY